MVLQVSEGQRRELVKVGLTPLKARDSGQEPGALGEEGLRSDRGLSLHWEGEVRDAGSHRPGAATACLAICLSLRLKLEVPDLLLWPGIGYS